MLPIISSLLKDCEKSYYTECFRESLLGKMVCTFQYRYLFSINISHLLLVKSENVEPAEIKDHVLITS